MDSPARLRLQGMAMLAVALVVGALVGVAGERVRSATTAPQPRFERGVRPGRGVLPRPFQELDLTDEQRDQITAVMESRRSRTESLMRELLLPLRTEMDSVRSAIAEILTPEQLTKLNETFDSLGTRRGFGGPGRGARRRFGPPRN